MSEAPLGSLVGLLRDEPAVMGALGDPSARIAVAEVARPVSIAALARLSERQPLVVACATGTDAARLHDDLCQLLPMESVALFPAWETLPFERVSPPIETMGRRLEVLWRLRRSDDCPRVIVAGVRALLQRLGPGADEISALEVAHGDVIDPEAIVRDLVAAGYRREELVEHRGEFARRGAIIDVFPSTADRPVRIDLWGDEVDRLTEFGVNDQRSISDIKSVRIFPARELTPDAAVRERAASLVASDPWGREQWERLAEGTHFDGMESWLPWLVDSDLLITDLLPESARVLLVEPRRMRDRAADLIAEEDDLARTLAQTWARDPEVSFPRLHVDPDRLLAGSGSFWTMDSAPESPDTPIVESSGWGPVGGDIAGLTNRLRDLISSGTRVVVAADGEGSANRITESFLEQGLELARASASTDLSHPGGYVTVAPIHRGWHLPRAKVAVICESDLTGRRRAHRRPRQRTATTTFEGLRPGSYVVHEH
ncbi:MAG: transcription-repair coupling factor, partial [Ilumatobacteraceae bacterium]